LTPVEYYFEEEFTEDEKSRFFASFKRKKEGCWEWNKARNHGGYGTFYHNKRTWIAHRISWILHYGKLEKGMFVLHKCDNPACVRPDHLFVGTNKDNLRDCAEKGRIASGERNGNSKMTNSTVKKIRKLSNCGMKGTEIANLVGVHKSTVSRVLRKIIWRHI